MTTPEPQSPEPEPRDRIHRSAGGIAGGVLLLAVGGWLGIDAVISGEGRTPWLALATLILVVPLIVAFTLRPAVYVDADRLRIRNPFRVIVLPWGQVASLRSGYSNEVVARSGTKYQLWALPVSLRARKRAARQEARAAADGSRGVSDGRGPGRGRGLGFGGLGRPTQDGSVQDGPVRAETDRIMDELRELQQAREGAETAQGEVTVRWAYEVAGPAVAGAVLLVILLAVG
ncbi:PH domain-containing protein [Streptomyces sp. TRM68367]|uniref:PH domain-containing protein n=1 Tax=Streptomyces sp. TRM68367 TaxID=2758415 RepID=UPI00165A682E|nr:PH domain-containing protein [Streptomyces sp. TRM68367]MBC9730498.1 PH domain-containing protein [Streptomyces sp. TRM68367]